MVDPNKWKTKVPQALKDAEAKANAAIEGDKQEPKNTDLEVKNDQTNPQVTDQPIDDKKVVEPETDPDKLLNMPVTEDTFEQKYKVLQGKFDKQMGDLNQRVTELSGNLQRANETIYNQNQLILSMQAEKAATPAQPQLPEEPEFPSLDFNDDSYTEEEVQIAKTVNSMANVIKDLRSQVKGLEGQLGTRIDMVQQTVEQANREALHNQITALCPHWQTVNELQEFISWMGEINLGRLQDAYRKGNAPEVSKYFNKWIKATGWTPQGQAQPGLVTTTGMENQIVPDTVSTGSGVVPSQQAGRVTETEYQKALQDRIKGRINDEQFNKIVLGYQKTIQEARSR